MWTCPKCSAKVGAGLELCRNCGAFRDAQVDSGDAPAMDSHESPGPRQETEPGEPLDQQPQTDPPQTAEPRQGFEWLTQLDLKSDAAASAGWVCPGCGETVPVSFQVCWKCRTARPADADAGDPQEEPHSDAIPEVMVLEEADVVQEDQSGPRATFRFFRDSRISWEGLFQRAAAFASKLGPERVISISHSSDANNGVVVVWYWDK